MKYFNLFLLLSLLSVIVDTATAQTAKKSTPIFQDGEAQIVPAFQDSSKWIRHDLWVETTFDTDGDNQLDRMHVAVTRPAQTDSEKLQLPIVYNTSPYFAGVAPFVEGLFWDVKQELGDTAKERLHPGITRTGKRPIISNSHIMTWVPRGYIVVHSSSPGTGLSQGCLLYTSPSPRDATLSRMPSSA